MLMEIEHPGEINKHIKLEYFTGEFSILQPLPLEFLASLVLNLSF